MNKKIQVTVLVENTVHTGGLMAEHGLAYFIQIAGRNILFDTGQTDLLVENARKLRIDLAGVDTVVLSHGHYDHTGGLRHILPLAPRSQVYLHPDALASKHTRNPDGSSRFIGVTGEMAKELRGAPLVYWTTEFTDIGDGLFVTGPIPRTTAYEDVGGAFYLDADCLQPDALLDDQALFFESRQGIHVILGCGHAGVINTLRHIQQITGVKSIHSVMGGMHLLSASHERLDQTISALRQIGVQRLGPAHCTGFSATAAMWNAFPGKCFSCSTGTRLKINGC